MEWVICFSFPCYYFSLRKKYLWSQGEVRELRVLLILSSCTWDPTVGMLSSWESFKDSKCRDCLPNVPRERTVSYGERKLGIYLLSESHDWMPCGSRHTKKIDFIQLGWRIQSPNFGGTETKVKESKISSENTDRHYTNNTQRILYLFLLLFPSVSSNCD